MNAGLVVGADSVIGEALLAELGSRGWRAVGTSRRAGADATAGRFNLDLSENPAGEALEPALRAVLGGGGPAAAFIVAAITGYERCSKDPSGTRQVNVEGVLAVARRLVARDVFVTYPSSSAVFEKSATAPIEDTPTAPATEYGSQKADCETEMLRLNQGTSRAQGAAVVRLTKVVHAQDERMRDWARNLKAGRSFAASADLKIAPVSLRHAVAALVSIADARKGGIYHVSGERALSYLEFARRLAAALGTDEALVRPQAPQRSPQGDYATALTVGPRSLAAGIRPQAVDSVVRDVVEDLKGKC